MIKFNFEIIISRKFTNKDYFLFYENKYLNNYQKLMY